MPNTPTHKRAETQYPVEPVLLTRWSPRAFGPEPVSDDQLRTLFTAASWAASSYNEQPWRFVVGRRGEPAWQLIFTTLTEQNQAWAGAAPVLYASFAKKHFSHNGSPNKMAVHDVGAASAQIALQASALGFEVHGMAGFNNEALDQAFQVGEEYHSVACWALGAPGDPEGLPENFRNMELAPRQRKPLGEFVFTEWNKPAL